MKDRYVRFLESQWVRWGLIPFLLLLFWIGATILQIVINDKSFLVLPYNHSASNFTKITYAKLLKGDTIRGEFQAKENHLGIVAIRFEPFTRVPYAYESSLEFRLRQKGQKNWYYQNAYRSGLVYDVPLFPFGFPVINDSKGKTYEFEVESLNANQNNAVALSSHEPVLLSKYQESKSFLLHDKKALLVFVGKKVRNAIQTVDISYTSFVFLLPFLSYIFLVSPLGSRIVMSLQFSKLYRKLEKRQYFGLSFQYFLAALFIVFIILINILFLQLTYTMLYLVLILMWVSIVGHREEAKKMTYVAGMFLLLLSPIALYTSFEHRAELLSAWAFLFFVAGLLQDILAFRKQFKHN